MHRIPETIKHLIIINILVFVVPQLLELDLTNIFALHYTENSHFGFWQYLSHLFMHGSLMHIGFNMYALWAFGAPLEQMWGKNKFLFFYFSAGIGAGLIYTLANYYQFSGVYNQLIQLGVSANEIQQILNTGSYNTALIEISNEDMSSFYSVYHSPAVGASGAVYGVLVAFGLAFPNAKLALIFLPIPIAAKYFIPVLILGDVFFGVTSYSVGHIAHFAHVGGALIGFIIACYWKRNQFHYTN